ncbi:MAG: DUF4396 domain-containing protein [Candidatus Eremiobacteraeota bacterium]|nr:DUF4396 domain-containing protein [Candidatus Eremiobacteraeota bacterium]MBC5803611.1 DUF4396 domain-containing protein [Candidatus Eremiobacteraeota bacterium]MBC5820690.1 DUF4396 domain-containing protein [Candidatus Eremiobacteraeota bacterium]
MKIMRFGWVLVTLYLGPVAAVCYVLSCREPAPGTHEEFVRPMWKQALGSTIHCVAGDATGIIIAAVITAAVGTPMWVDLVTEYAFGFAFGLLVFQSLFLKDMMGGSYVGAVRNSFFPEFISMNMMMAAMFPTMLLLMMGRDMRAMEPTQPLFWGVMSLAVGVGLIVAYPANWWLVQAKLKHGMGTVRALGQGGHSVAAERQSPQGWRLRKARPRRRWRACDGPPQRRRGAHRCHETYRYKLGSRRDDVALTVGVRRGRVDRRGQR